MKTIDVVDLTRKMVAYDTVSAKSNLEFAVFLQGILSDMGFLVEELHVKDYVEKSGAIEVKKANLIARVGPRGVEPLVLSGHMDVMPVGKLQDWVIEDPFKLTERGGKLYGRGSVDMKGPIAAMICAAGLFLEGTPKLRRELIFCLTHDEEVGLKGARRIVADKRLTNPKFIMIAEPTELTPVRMHKGHLCLRAICKGEKAHASCPQKGVNAIGLAVRVVRELEKFGEELKGLREPCIDPSHTTLNIAVIKGEAKLNEVPDECEVDFAIRPIPGQSAKAIQDYITHRLTNIGWTRKTSEPLVRVELFEKDRGRLPTEPMSTSAESELVRVAEKVSGKSACGAAYSTDASVLQQLGADCLIFGPGNIDVAHKPNEFIEASQLRVAVGIFKDIVREICLER